jgi:predicted membrane protein
LRCEREKSKFTPVGFSGRLSATRTFLLRTVGQFFSSYHSTGITMNESLRRNSVFQVIIGALAILFGVLFILDNFRILRVDDALEYWPILLVVFGVVQLSKPNRRHGYLFYLILIFVGAVMLIGRLTEYYISIWDFWPVVLVLLGVSIIWRGAVFSGAPQVSREFRSSEPTSDSLISIFSCLSANKQSNVSPQFAGGTITTILGGATLELRGATIQGNSALIDIFVCWGGVELYIPREWSVVLQCTPILGGCSNKTYPAPAAPTKTLILRGTIIMGGVEVKN